MQLVSEVVEDVYNDSTQTRTAACVPYHMGVEASRIRLKKQRRSLSKPVR